MTTQTFTTSNIRELIIPQLRQQAEALGLQNLHQAANAMEYILQFVEWTPIETAPKDGTRIFGGYADDGTAVCDEPGCLHDASGGWPSPEGYRQTCHEHRKLGAQVKP
jgi:hypothetical protein